MSGYGRKRKRQRMHAGDRLLHRMVRNHEDVLQNIEAVFIAAHRRREGLDDRACHAAIEANLLGTPPPDPMTTDLTAELKRVRLVRSDVDEDVWQDCLRVVAQSVRDHSDRRVGRTDYLDFINVFFP